MSQTDSKKASSKVLKAWSNAVGRQINFETREVHAADGRVQTHLINPDTGSLVVAVNATGADAEKALVEHAGDTFIDAGFTDLDVQGGGTAVNIDPAKGEEPVGASAQPGPVFPESDPRSGANKVAPDTTAKGQPITDTQPQAKVGVVGKTTNPEKATGGRAANGRFAKKEG